MPPAIPTGFTSFPPSLTEVKPNVLRKEAPSVMLNNSLSDFCVIWPTIHLHP